MFVMFLIPLLFIILFSFLFFYCCFCCWLFLYHCSLSFFCDQSVACYVDFDAVSTLTFVAVICTFSASVYVNYVSYSADFYDFNDVADFNSVLSIYDFSAVVSFYDSLPLLMSQQLFSFSVVGASTAGSVVSYFYVDISVSALYLTFFWCCFRI